MFRLVTVIGVLGGVSAAIAEPVRMTSDDIRRAMPGALLEIYPVIEDLVIQIGLKTLLGMGSSAATTRLKDLLEELFDVMYSIKYILSPYNLPGGPYQRSVVVSKQLSQAMRDLVAEKRATGLQGDDVLTQLIHLMDASSDFTLDDLLGTTMGIFRGMYPNAATALVCSFLLLALFPKTADDVLQETFWQVWKSVSTYRPQCGSFSGWLFRMARQVAIDASHNEKARLKSMTGTARN